ncbi:MAG: TRAP transporter small permease, partial [Ketobacteraceae bacterium]|nr:TRAP transporter small permease [Ketobacteraceae bacterium]
LFMAKLAGVRRFFQRIDSVLNWLEKSLLIISILLMASVSIINVIARNLGSSLTFANELAQLLLVVVTFIGVGHGVREGRHIRVSAIHDMLPHRGRKVLLVITSFTTCALMALLGVYSIGYVANLADSGRIMPSLQLPLYLAYSVVPLGLFVGAMQFFLAGVKNLLNRDNYLSWHHRDEYELPEDARDAEKAHGMAD